jgi:hypothetical protein
MDGLSFVVVSFVCLYVCFVKGVIFFLLIIECSNCLLESAYQSSIMNEKN